MQIQKHIAIKYKVLLLPEIGTVIKRDAGRQNDITMGEASVTRHHKTFSTESFYENFKRLDTSNQSIEETVDSILNIVS